MKQTISREVCICKECGAQHVKKINKNKKVIKMDNENNFRDEAEQTEAEARAEEDYIARKAAKSDAEEEASAKLEAELI